MDGTHPLLGRGRELAAIDGLLDAARAGRSGVLVIDGEPGIGKTALLDHAMQAAADATVLRAAGIQSELDLPYGGLGRLLQPASRFVAELEPTASGLLAEILGQGHAAPVPIRDRFGAGLATLSMFASIAEDRPLVVLVDDVHWMDAPTVEAVAFAARRLLADGVAIILGRRLGHSVERLEELPRLELGGLGPEDSRQLLERRGVHVPEHRLTSLVAATGGNPLALMDLPSLLTPDDIDGVVPPLEPVPVGARLQEAYGRTLRELSVETREALLVAAILENAEVQLLAAALAGLGRSIDDLGQAEDADVVRLTNTGVTFRHPLIRSAVVQSMSPTTRRRCHRAIADALAAAVDRDPMRQAWHLAAAATGLDAEAAGQLAAVAGDATLVGGFAVGVARLRSAPPS